MSKLVKQVREGFRYDPQVRDRIYSVAIAVVTLAGAYGLVAGDKADAWVLVIGAVLGMAKKNVSY